MRAGRARRSTQDDIPRLGALFSRVFGVERAPEVWRWKYFDNPIGAHSWVWETDTGEIVFHCGATESPFRNRGKSCVAAQLTDFMSNPFHPGGIGPGSPFGRTVARFFGSLTEENRVSILYGFPGERHRLVGEKLLGYQAVAKVGQLELSPSGDSTRPRPLEALDLERLSRTKVTTGIMRSVEWLDWRYLQRPDRSYQIVSDPDFDAILGRDEQGWNLMEISLRDGGSERRAVGVLAELGRPVRGWFDPDHPLTAKLADAGFEASLRDHSLTAARFLDDPKPARRHYFEPPGAVGEPFYYTLGDYDVE